MAVDEQRKKMEDAEKVSIIESEIEIPIEALGAQLADERKTRLKKLTKPELQQLAHDVKAARTPQDAITITVEAICDSEEQQRTADDKKYDGLGGPARMDMDF